MVLDWFSSRNVDVADLIARKKYSKAIDVMRTQFKQRPPGVETRLQFVDVLILAGRGKEAVPVLITLADEVSPSEPVKAIGLLKRIEQIEPNRKDVEERLAALVKKEYETPPPAVKWAPAGKAPALASGAHKVTLSQRVTFDIEAFEDEVSQAELASAENVKPATEPQAEAASIASENTVPAAASPDTETPPVRSEEVVPVVDEATPLVEPDSTNEQPGSGDPSVTGQIRGAFRRFLSSLPAGEAARAEAAAAEAATVSETLPLLEPDAEPETAEAQPATPADAAEPAIVPEPEVEANVDPEPEVEADVEPEPEAETAPLVEANAVPEEEPEPADFEVSLEPDAPAETLTEAAFQGQVLDLIEEVVQRPLPVVEATTEPEPGEKPVRTRGVAESAQRLVASPLFRDLREQELLAVVRGMRLHTYEAGDIVMTEGEPGDSLFIVTTGAVRMFVRNPAGHNFEMGVLKDGEFFGELSSLSGRPRAGTVVASGHTEMLELDKRTLDQIARSHPRVREMLESVYIERASSPEAAAIRAVPVDAGSHQRAIEVLEAYFGESRWEPRMRLRLADLLVKAGKQEDAVPLLVGLAADLDRAGYPEKAIAILKKIERIRKHNVEEVNLAPLKKKAKAPEKPVAPVPAAPPRAPAPGRGGRGPSDNFSSWIVDVVRDAVAPQANTDLPLPPSVAPGYAKGLLASPLFEGLGEDELFEMIRELRLLSFDPGDIIITEGEPGQSLFILTAGLVKVSVKNAQGKNVHLLELRAGSFFGEMATVSGKPRTATVTAGQRCELLELDKPALDHIAGRHPRVREVLEEIYIARATSPDAARVRAGGPSA